MPTYLDEEIEVYTSKKMFKTSSTHGKSRSKDS